MSLFQRIVAGFRPIVTISADAGSIVFKRGENEARSEPLIRFAEDGTLIEVGRPAMAAKGGRLVQLFSENGGNDEDAIRAFCRYHLMLTSDGNLLGPRITIVESTFRNTVGIQVANIIQKVLRAEGFQAEMSDGA